VTFASFGEAVWRAISSEPLSFFIGAVFGVIAASRWQVTRRDSTRTGRTHDDRSPR
jgi:hypothetical protein